MLPNRFQRLCAFSIAIVPLVLLPTRFVSADTWTDKTGQYKVDAEYAGVEGASVVLRKSDGSTIKVPINRLSDASRAQAKKLYDAAKTPSTGSQPAAPANPSSTSRALIARKLKFNAPVAPAIPALPSFPENASLQETVDFVVAQFQAGHPEVFWHALPAEVRNKIDSQEIRTAMNKSQGNDQKATEEVIGVALKVVQILVTKKQFIMNSPMMAQVPPPMMPMIRQGYDPTVGTVFETVMLIDSLNRESEQRTITEILDERGPKLGAHIKGLLKMAPPGMVSSVMDGIQVEQQSSNSGIIRVPNQEGGLDETEMVVLGGRWVPKDMAVAWDASKDNLVEVMDSPEQMQGNPFSGQAASQMVIMANGILDPMLAANSQPEFNQAVMQVMNMAQMFMPAGLPQ